MAMQLGRTISDGIKRVATLTGGILLIILIAIQLLVQSSINTMVVGLFPPGPAGEIEVALGLTLPVSGTVAAGVFAVSVVLSSVYFVVLARALTRPLEALSTFPTGLFTHRIVRATLSMLVGGIIVWVAVFIGTLFLFLPGIFLATCFLFFIFAIGVEDMGPLGALKRSWDLSQGNRLKLAVLVIFSAVIGIMIGIMSTIFDIAGSALVGELITNTLSSVLFVVLYGMMASAYVQIQDNVSRRGGDSGVSESLGSISS